MFAQLDRNLSRHAYIAGDVLPLADIAIGPMVYRWYKLGLAQPDTGNLHKLLQCLETRPGLSSMWSWHLRKHYATVSNRATLHAT